MRSFRLRDESGIALIAVLGVLSVVTVIAIAAFAASRQTLHEAVGVRNESHAFQLANAAIDSALANIQRNGFVTADYPITGSLEGGSYEVTVAPTLDSEYVATATGNATDGTSETIQVKFFFLNIWEMNLAAGSDQSLTAGGGGLHGNANIYGPFYAVGTLELGGSSSMEKGPLFIRGGDIVTGGSARVGTTAVPINVYCDGALSGSPSSFHIANFSQSVPSITLPRVDDTYLTEAWMKAKSESIDNIMGYPDKSTTVNRECTGGNAATYQTIQPPNSGTWTRNRAAGATLQYKYVGPGTGPSAAGAGTTGLTIGGTGSFGSWDGDGHYDIVGSHDDFAYDDVNNILYVEGTVFVDGPLTIADNIRYKGNGTIVANGDIHVNGNFVPYSELNASEALGLVTPASIYIHHPASNKDIDDPPDLSGAFFAMNNIEFDFNVLMVGSVIAGGIVFDHPNTNLVTNPLLPSFLPESMPGKGISLLTRGAWSRP